jgi:GNAT superfamily N-acetyltransferase
VRGGSPTVKVSHQPPKNKSPFMQYTQEITITPTTVLTEAEQRQLHALWNNEYPALFNYQAFEDFQNYILSLQDVNHYCIKHSSEEIIAWASDFMREDERWFGVIVRSDHQRSGLGAYLMQHLKAKNPALSGWMIDNNRELKSDGTYYQSPHLFYRLQDFEFHPDEHMGFDRISAIKITWKNEKTSGL